MLHNSSTDMHSDAWWMRVFEGALSPEEEMDWQAHLVQCGTCRQEWAAMMHVDQLLRTAAPPPMLAPEFTARTVTRIVQKQKARHIGQIAGGMAILGLVAWLGWAYLGATLADVEHALNVMVAGRQVLFAALMRALVGLLVTLKALLPLLLGMTGALLLFLAPNSILASVVFVWVSQRRRAGVTV